MSAKSVSTLGIDTLKRLEGFRARAYLDSVGVPTIGYGSTEDVQLGDSITEMEAERRLRNDVAGIERDIQRLVKVPLAQAQFDALVCFIYNIGAGAFARSTALRVLNAERYDLVDDEMRRWVYGTDRASGERVKLNGLVRRRMIESDLWNAEDAPATDPRPRPLVPSSPDIEMNPVGEPGAVPAQRGQVAAATATGIGAAGVALSETAQSLAPVSQSSAGLQLLFVGLALIGAVFTVVALTRRRQ
jgi:lysozyme